MINIYLNRNGNFTIDAKRGRLNYHEKVFIDNVKSKSDLLKHLDKIIFIRSHDEKGT